MPSAADVVTSGIVRCSGLHASIRDRDNDQRRAPRLVAIELLETRSGRSETAACPSSPPLVVAITTNRTLR